MATGTSAGVQGAGWDRGAHGSAVRRPPPRETQPFRVDDEGDTRSARRASAASPGKQSARTTAAGMPSSAPRDTAEPRPARTASDRRPDAASDAGRRDAGTEEPASAEQGPPAGQAAAPPTDSAPALVAAAAGETKGGDLDDETDGSDSAEAPPSPDGVFLSLAPAPAAPQPTAGGAPAGENAATAAIEAHGPSAHAEAASAAAERSMTQARAKDQLGEAAAAAPGGPVTADAAPALPSDATLPAPAQTAPAAVDAPADIAGASTRSEPAGPPVTLGAVPITIGLRALAGSNRFEIRLDPADLGRIEVSLDIDREHRAKAHLVVERPETLALLQRDARSLEQALAQAGFEASDAAVSFSLRDGSGGQGQAGGGDSGRPQGRTPHGAGEAELAPVPAAPVMRLAGRSGLDIRI
ncbi:flagellar hook-length control protein FliK [Methylobacterium oryzisoli]|uniref:flagellar hook-length control protein FliK n=1 Tax=Methylobacterium oryzisoli TaxID=3385502 RepID=UPI00389259D1